MEKQIVVTGCHDCPFLYCDYDDYALGHDTIEVCNLAEFLHLPEYFIRSYNRSEIEMPEIPEDPPNLFRIEGSPKWCPLSENGELEIKKNL